MNIWVEYWKKSNEPSKNNHAQMRENAKWVEPDPKKVHKRFCQNREQALELANSYQELEWVQWIEILNATFEMKEKEIIHSGNSFLLF